jgi:hypothetical protein
LTTEHNIERIEMITVMDDVLTLARILRMVPVVVHSTYEQGGKDGGLTLRYSCVKWKDSVLTTYKIMNSSYVFFL